MKEIFKESIFSHLPRPRFTRFRNLKIFDWMNQNAPGKIVVNLGSGTATFDQYLSEKVKAINLDIESSKPHLHVVADAHFLPFKDGSVDIVYSIAVLEHVKRPWVVAEEIHRVLCPGGHVVLELPFLNIIHDKYDYFRFTDKGIRSLFNEDAFDVVLSQVGSGGGSFLSVFLLFYFKQFFPTKYIKAFWLIVMAYPSSLFKFLDVLTRDPEELRITANSFSFIGKKR